MIALLALMASATQARLDVLLAVLGVAVVVGFVLLRHASTAAFAVKPVSSAAKPAAAKLLVVDVSGAVQQPGLYPLWSGSRLGDAIAAAGGATAKARLEAVNVAAPLADGERVFVPGLGAGGAAAASAPAAMSSSSGPLILGTATAEQLDALPGIGPVTAQKILDYQRAHGPFHSVAELEGVSGIGPRKLAGLMGLVTP